MNDFQFNILEINRKYIMKLTFFTVNNIFIWHYLFIPSGFLLLVLISKFATSNVSN
jgi:hypothetical protein